VYLLVSINDRNTAAELACNKAECRARSVVINMYMAYRARGESSKEWRVEVMGGQKGEGTKKKQTLSRKTKLKK